MISICAKCGRNWKYNWKEYWNKQESGEWHEQQWLHLCDNCYAKK